MQSKVTIVYSERLIRRAVFEFWRRSVGWKLAFALILCLIGLTALIISGDRSWLVGAVGAMTAIGIVFFVLVYVAHYRNSIAMLHALESRTSELLIEAETITMSSSAGRSSLPWASVKEVWKFREVWLLLFSKSQFVTLPLEYLSLANRKLIAERVSAFGGKVDA